MADCLVAAWKYLPPATESREREKGGLFLLALLCPHLSLADPTMAEYWEKGRKVGPRRLFEVLAQRGSFRQGCRLFWILSPSSYLKGETGCALGTFVGPCSLTEAQRAEGEHLREPQPSFRLQ